VIFSLAGLTKYNDVPKSTVPLHLTMIDSEQGFQNMIDTKGIKACDFDSRIFQVPKGYKPVADDRDLRSVDLEGF
jgi:hypothetical protein